MSPSSPVVLFLFLLDTSFIVTAMFVVSSLTSLWCLGVRFVWCPLPLVIGIAPWSVVLKICTWLGLSSLRARSRVLFLVDL